MGYVICGTNLIGIVTLRRDSSDAAVKKAAELVADGYREVHITAPDGHLIESADTIYAPLPPRIMPHSSWKARCVSAALLFNPAEHY